MLKYTKTDEPVPDLPSSAGTSSGISKDSLPTTDSIAPTEPDMVAASNTGPTTGAEVTSSAAGIESVTAAAAVPVTKTDAMPNTSSGTSKNAMVVSTMQQKDLEVTCNFGTKPDLEAKLPSGLLPVNKHDSKKRDSMDGNKMVQPEVIDLSTPVASTGGRNDGTPTVDLSPVISPRTQSTINAAKEIVKKLEEQKADHKKELDELWAANKQSEALAKARHDETLAAVRVGTEEVVKKVETEGEKNRMILSNQITRADRERAAEQRAKDAEEQKVQFQLKEESDAKEAERKKESNAKEAELKKKIEEVEAKTKAVHAQAIKAVREEAESTRHELWMAIDALEARIEEKLEVLVADSTEAHRASIEALKAECLKKKDEASNIGDFLKSTLKSTLQGFQDAASEIFNQNKLAAISA